MSENSDYRDEMREKSNFDLQEIINDYPNSDRDRVIAALRELERRDVLYSDNRKLLEDLLEEKEGSSISNPIAFADSPLKFFRDPNIVDDFNAPRLYSRYAIRFFAILFSNLFGGILLSVNLHRLGKKTEIYYVIAFSALFSYLVFYTAGLYPNHVTTVTLIMNLLGSLVLEEFFWKRYIGKHFKFRKQSLTGALMIGFGISLFLLYILMSAS